MQKLFFFFSLVLLVVFPFKTSAASTSPVVISEIAWAGSSISAADEWIELSNVTPEPVDVSGWSLEGVSTSPIVLKDGSVINPYSTFLIANYDSTNTNSSLTTSPNFVSTSISISNDKLSVSLYSKEHIIVDSAGNSGSPFSEGSASTGNTPNGQYRSMLRGNKLDDGILKYSWVDATQIQNTKPIIQDFGTPGFYDFEVPVSSVVSTVESTIYPEEVVLDVESITILEPEPVESVLTEPTTEPVVPQTDVTTNTSTTTTDIIVETIPVVELSVPIEVVSYSYGSLRINEIYSNPQTDETEWLELVNTTPQTINTEGWTLEDSGGSVTQFPLLNIQPDQFFFIDSPKGKLNNDGDSVIIKSPSSSIIDSMSYGTNVVPTPSKSESLIRNTSGQFVITTTPTKGTQNIQTDRVVKKPIETKTTSVETQPVVETIQPEILTVKLSEVYPNTTDNDETEEFIELINTGDKSLSLNGFVLEDASENKHTINTNEPLLPHSRYVLKRTESHLTLNNTGDSLTLTSPSGKPVDSITYENTKQGFSFCDIEGVWVWTGTPTPNEPNILTTPNTSSNETSTPTVQEQKPVDTSEPSKGSTTTHVSLIKIIAAKKTPVGTRVIIRGIVNSLPGVLGSKYFYLQDDSGGIQIYKNDGVFPVLKIGQTVEVVGVISLAYGEQRVKAASITLTSNQPRLVDPKPIQSLDDKQQATIGSLVTVSGTVVSRNVNKTTLDVNGNKVVVDVPKNSQVDPTIFSSGVRVAVNGILTQSNNELRIKPRSPDDVSLSKEELSQTTSTYSGKELKTSSQQTIAAILTIATVLILAGLWLKPKFYEFLRARKQTHRLAT